MHPAARLHKITFDPTECSFTSHCQEFAVSWPIESAVESREEQIAYLNIFRKWEGQIWRHKDQDQNMIEHKWFAFRLGRKQKRYSKDISDMWPVITHTHTHAHTHTHTHTHTHQSATVSETTTPNWFRSNPVWMTCTKNDIKSLSYCCMLSFGWFPGGWNLYADVSERSVPSS